MNIEGLGAVRMSCITGQTSNRKGGEEEGRVSEGEGERDSGKRSKRESGGQER